MHLFCPAELQHWLCAQTITGATAAVAIGWIYPSLILAKWEGPGAWGRKLGAALIICLGLVTAVVALEGVLEPWITSIWG